MTQKGPRVWIGPEKGLVFSGPIQNPKLVNAGSPLTKRKQRGRGDAQKGSLSLSRLHAILIIFQECIHMLSVIT